MEPKKAEIDHNTPQAKLALQKQVEYYLSDQNLKRDRFFHDLIKNNKEVSVHGITDATGLPPDREPPEVQQNQEDGREGGLHGHRGPQNL